MFNVRVERPIILDGDSDGWFGMRAYTDISLPFIPVNGVNILIDRGDDCAVIPDDIFWDCTACRFVVVDECEKIPTRDDLRERLQCLSIKWFFIAENDRSAELIRGLEFTVSEEKAYLYF